MLKKSRYRNKREETLSAVEFEGFYENAKKLEELREINRKTAAGPAALRIKPISVCGLLSILFYTGLRITEICGDPIHIYKVKVWDNTTSPKTWTGEYEEKKSEEIHGILKKNVEIVGDK